jgi:pantoate--beta-alanine ligase
MQVIETIAEMQAAARRLHRERKHIGFVPTMGALHAGHLSLVRAARRESDVVVVSIFVNPLQFGPREDFRRYPRAPEADRTALAGLDVDILFAPAAEEMYPPGFQTHVEVEGLSRPLEGRSRPGHFRGVATVVAKLFLAVRPDTAYFGQKDAQQGRVVSRMAEDLNMGVAVKIQPTAREPDGLALSSRNAYLRRQERLQAVCLSRALAAAGEAARAGERRAASLKRIMRKAIAESPKAEVDYIAVVDPETMKDVKTVSDGTLLALAVRIGRTRLIDNAVLSLPGN